eukprot:2775187-Pyramimonas_sp.AAC.2
MLAVCEEQAKRVEQLEEHVPIRGQPPGASGSLRNTYACHTHTKITAEHEQQQGSVRAIKTQTVAERPNNPFDQH